MEVRGDCSCGLTEVLAGNRAGLREKPRTQKATWADQE